MPGEDRKGPQSQGPRTGRGLGRCNDSRNEANPTDDQLTTENRLNPGLGRGPGRGPGRGLGRGPGRGGGRGRGRGFGR